MMFVDSNHAANKHSRRSRTGFMLYVNMSLINCYSKKQSTIETSVFGADFVAMKVRFIILHAIQYNMRMMGSPTCLLSITPQSKSQHLRRSIMQ